MSIPFTTGARRRAPVAVGSQPLRLPTPPVTGLVLLVVLVILDLAALTPGVPIG